MAIYNYISLVTARQQLANRLYDSGMVFWSSAELTLYLVEALRTWNALTSYWRGDFIFPSQTSTTWYDLTTVANTLRPLTLTDRDLYTAMQYHLLEPTTWNPWTGASVQFSADDLLQAVGRRRDEILSTCSCTVTRRSLAAVPMRTVLPDSVIDVRRMVFFSGVIGAGYGSGPYGIGPYGISPSVIPIASVVWPDDAWSEQSFNRNYTISPAGVPSTYLLSTQPPISFDTDIPPLPGTYELLTIEAGPMLTVSTPIGYGSGPYGIGPYGISPSALSIPDDWTHVIKWGALADLLSRESNAKDSLRAQYCEQRYQMGLKLLSNASALLALRIGNVPLQIDSVRAADTYQTSWQGQAAGTPTAAFHAGLNLVALSPQPDAGPYSLMATVVQNAPVPVLDADLVQVGRDDLDVVIDYAQHLASFKMGGSEFLSTMPLFQRFLQQASVYGLKLAELGEFTKPLYELSQRENQQNPVMAPQEAPVAG